MDSDKALPVHQNDSWPIDKTTMQASLRSHWIGMRAYYWPPTMRNRAIDNRKPA